MRPQLLITSVALSCLLMSGVTGCVWPVMTEENGHRPLAMGKSDQVLWPWATQPVHLHENYGIAYRQAVEGQILNPEASKNLEPVAGPADPTGLQYSLRRYQQMFETPPYSEFDLKSSGGGASPGKDMFNSLGGSAGGKK